MASDLTHGDGDKLYLWSFSCGRGVYARSKLTTDHHTTTNGIISGHNVNISIVTIFESSPSSHTGPILARYFGIVVLNILLDPLLVPLPEPLSTTGASLNLGPRCPR